MSHFRRTDLSRMPAGHCWRRAVLLTALAAGCLGLSLAPSRADAGRRPARRVVVVIAADVDWSRVTARGSPTLYGLLTGGTLTNVVVKRQTGHSKVTAPSQAALTLSAGVWTPLILALPAAYDSSETIAGGKTAAQAYGALLGRSPGAASVLFLGIRRAEQAQAQASLGGQVGALGASFEASGGIVAAVGNSDWGDPAHRVAERPAGVGATDEAGLVAEGTVSESLLTSDASAPYGIRTDAAAFSSAYEAVSDLAATDPDASLILLDAGDTYRVSTATQQSGGRHPEWERISSANLEQAVSLGTDGLTPDDLIIVLSVPTYGSVAHPQGFGSAVLWGREFSERPGVAASPSTRHGGLVTLPDLSATALDAAGMAPPRGFIGAPVKTVAGPSDLGQRLSILVKADRTARSTLAVKYVVVAYAALAALIASGVALAMAAWTHRRGRQLSRAAAWALEATLLLAASVPVGTWLAFAIQRSPQTRSAVIVTGLLAAGVVWLAAIVLRATTPPRVALAFVTLGTAVLFAVDQWVGAPLSVTAPLGYSPLEAARFYGLGNEAAALMLSGAVIGLAVGCDQIASKRRRQGMEWLVPVAGFVLVATAVLPRLGANLGVAAWGTFLVVVATRLMSRGRLTWRLVVLGVVIAALATASAVWISSVSSAETHVARTVSSAESSGIGALWTLLVRKAGANLSYLVRFPGIVVFFAIFAGLALGAFRPRGVWGRVADGNPSFNGAMQAILLTCVVAYFSEDSGILMAVTLVDLTLIAFAYLSIAAARAKPLMPPEMSGGEAA